jgi:hypothetical protein
MTPGAEPEPLAATTAPRYASHIAERWINGDLVLYDPARARLHLLNATAAVAWSLCDGTRDLTAIATALAERFPASRLAIAADVAELVRRLADDGLLVW